MSVYKNPSFAGSLPLARKSDPSSSHEAAKHMVESGALGTQHRIAYGLVRHHPGYTSDELARLGQLDRYQLARRLPELERAGLVEKGAIRKSRKTGRPAVVWFANPGR